MKGGRSLAKYGSALCRSDLGYGVRGREVESRNATCSQEIEEIQPGYSCQLCRLPERQTFCLQVVDRCYKTHFV